MSLRSFQHLTDEEAVELRDLYKKKVEYQRQSPLTYHCPVPTQDGFHRSKARMRVAIGPNRTGKSQTGVAEDLGHAFGKRIWLPEDDPDHVVTNARGKPIAVPNHGTIVCESYQKVDEVIWSKINGSKEEALCPVGQIEKAPKNQQGVVAKIYYINGSTQRLMTYNQHPDEFEAFSSHYVHYDEPPPRAIYTACQRSLVDHSGRAWMTMTPLKEPWTYEEIVSKEGENENIEVYHLTTEELVAAGHMRQADYDYFYSTISDPAELEARKHGEYMHLQGRVFKGFYPKAPWFVSPFEIPPHWTRIMGIDPHPQKPIAALWIAISPDTDTWYAYRESYIPDQDVEDFMKSIYKAERGEHIAFRVIDSSSRENEKTSGSSVYAQMLDWGDKLWSHHEDPFCLSLAQKPDKAGRIRLLQGKFKLDRVYQTPGLTLFKSMHLPQTPEKLRNHFKFELMNHIWGRHQNKAMEDRKDPLSDVEKKNDDLIDIAEYLCQTGRHAIDFDPDADFRLDDARSITHGARAEGYGGY